MSTVETEVREIAARAKAAARRLAVAPTPVKNAALAAMASGLERSAEEILAENAKDAADARAAGQTAALVDRLTLTRARIEEMSRGIREVAALPDPVGDVTRMWTRPNGLRVGRMRIPLGVVGIIYEARPNVTADAACLCLKSGNAVVLKGGSEALRSNLAIARVLERAVEGVGLPPGAIGMIGRRERETVGAMLALEDLIDLVIPRGGEGLIRYVVERSRIPVLKHYKGVCHVFVDESADLEVAKRIIRNAKLQRPGVCNAMETLLVHEAIAETALPGIVGDLIEKGVEIRGCERTRSLAPEARAATEEDWSAEYLDLILSVRVVGGLDEAIDHIERYGSQHTETIVTKDYANAQRFLREVGSSVVLVNASTRFSDGGQLGLGAEIGISTTKLHAFGPMGLEEMTTTKFIVYGDGQVRE